MAGITRTCQDWAYITTVIDRRLGLAEARTPDPRLVLVVLDEASLREDPTPLGQMAERTKDDQRYVDRAQA